MDTPGLKPGIFAALVAGLKALRSHRTFIPPNQIRAFPGLRIQTLRLRSGQALGHPAEHLGDMTRPNKSGRGTRSFERWSCHDTGDEVEEDGAKQVEENHKEHYLESLAEGPHSGGRVLIGDNLRG